MGNSTSTISVKFYKSQLFIKTETDDKSICLSFKWREIGFVEFDHYMLTIVDSSKKMRFKATVAERESLQEMFTKIMNNLKFYSKEKDEERKEGEGEGECHFESFAHEFRSDDSFAVELMQHY